MRSLAPLLVAVAALAAAGCASPPDPLDVEGIELDADGVFRRIHLDAPPEQAFEAARRVVRFCFAGTPLVEDLPERSIESGYAALGGTAKRARLFLRVLPAEPALGGALVEIFIPIERLRADLEDHPEEPWLADGRDTLAENRVLQDIATLVNLEQTADPAAPPDA